MFQIGQGVVGVSSVEYLSREDQGIGGGTLPGLLGCMLELGWLH